MKTISTVSNIKKSPQSAPEPVSKVRAVLRELVEICPHPARLLELYYWSAEPELLETLHRYIGLPEQPRDALRAFLTMVADCPDSVCVNVSQNGDVTLSSPVIARLMNKMDSLRANTDQAEASH
jgi:hypothetical protein